MEELIPYSDVHAVKFYVLGSAENELDSTVTIKSNELFGSGETPIDYGIYDKHMGTTSYAWHCMTCNNRKGKCPGHFGSIRLNYPLKSPCYREYIKKWLNIICHKCGELVYTEKINASKSRLLQEYNKNSKKINKCANCEAPHYVVDADKYEQNAFFYKITDEKAIEKKKELFNHRILEIFNRVSMDTVIKVGKLPESHPSKFILTTLRVPPNTIRPDIRQIGGNRSNNSDITAILKEIVEYNNALPEEIPDDETIAKNTDLRIAYLNIDTFYYELVKGNKSTNNQIRIHSVSNKAPSSLASREISKQGRIRRNLMGKRSHYMMRSVITGDNTLKINEIGVPVNIARTMQIPETINIFNRNRLMQYFRNKRDLYPGCSKIIKKSDGCEFTIEFLPSDYIPQDGDIIYRDLINGDPVGFNRQPSLLPSNISCHKVVILPEGYTLRINVTACWAYNADLTTVEVGIAYCLIHVIRVNKKC